METKPANFSILILGITSLLLLTAPAMSEIAVRSDFDNGNGQLHKWDSEKQLLQVKVKRYNGCRNIWWHFQISGLTPGKTIRFVCDHDPVAGDINPVYSTDKVNWRRLDDENAPYKLTPDAETVWVARNIPYPYGKSVELANSLRGKENVQVSTLCKSEADHDVVMLRFTDTSVPDTDKKLIWIQARQHAFESHGSWIAHGFAQHLASEEAKPLLQKAILYVVPIMDVDNVFKGSAGKDQKPIDFNRCWSDKLDRWNAVDAAINTINAQITTNPLILFMDLHDPWYPEPHHWHIVPGSDREVITEFGEKFVENVAKIEGANSWKNWFLWPQGRSQPSGPTSTHYAKRTWMLDQSRAVSICMETAHFKDNDGRFMTSQGLLDFGRALGITAEYWTRSMQD